MNVDGVIMSGFGLKMRWPVPADALTGKSGFYVKDDSVTEAQGRVPAGFRESEGQDRTYQFRLWWRVSEIYRKAMWYTRGKIKRLIPTAAR